MGGCIFCEIVRGEAPSWTVYEDESTYAFLNLSLGLRHGELLFLKRPEQSGRTGAMG